MEAATFAMAYALSTSIGIRPFLTLAVASLAIHFGYIHIAHSFAYIGTDGATWIFAGLAVLEFAADKIPVVDHTLHAAGFAIKPICAMLLVGGALPDTGIDHPASTVQLASDAMAGVGALNALGVHGGLAALRGASSGLTMGIGNPLISLIEDVVAFCGIVLAIVLPWVAAFFALLIAIGLALVVRALFAELRRNRARAVTA